MSRSARIAIASLLIGACSSDASPPGNTGGTGGGGAGGLGGAIDGRGGAGGIVGAVDGLGGLGIGGALVGAGGLGVGGRYDGTGLLGIGGRLAGGGGQGNRAGSIGGGGAGGTGSSAGAGSTGAMVFQGRLPKLLNSGPPCTFEEGATGDRWCGFFADTRTTPVNVEIHVVNVTKAAAGVAITCGTADPNCLKLAGSSFQDDTHPEMFQGDTLVYYDSTGTPFAWRPGMPAGRPLGAADPRTKDLVLCLAAIKGPAVTCLRVLPTSMQPIPNVLYADLLAGRIDAAASPPLARIETVIATSLADRNVNRFRSGFPVPGTDVIAWSARAAAGGAEVLKMQTLGDDASRVTVGTDVNRWRVSPDGARWYWFGEVDDLTRVGKLQSAPFPGGASPATVAASMLQFDFPTPTALVTLTTAGDLQVFGDGAGAPGAGAFLDTGVLRMVGLGAMGYVAYYKGSVTREGTQFSDLYLKRADRTGACALTTAADGYTAGLRFTPNASGATWIQRTDDGEFKARYTRLPDCVTMDVATAVARSEPLGDRGVLYIDDFQGGARVGSLRFRAVTAGAVSNQPATLIGSEVGSFTALSSGGVDTVIYTVETGGSADGVYVRAFGP